ncbi:MAG TPA: hypothetical protein PL092_01945 [Candidatus Pacearchaeota archaeon]|nr:hypothetical protein [Candidatus Pacearchaeota archaeon]
MPGPEVVKLEGVDKAFKNFNKLEQAIKDDIIIFCQEEALKEELVPQYRTALPYSSRTVNSITIWPFSNKEPISTVGGPGLKGYNIRFADRGTKIRTTKMGYNRGFILGANRVPKIIFESVPRILKNFINEFKAQVEDEINKMNK